MILKRIKFPKIRKNIENSTHEYELADILLKILIPYLCSIKEMGLKNKISQMLPRVTLNEFILARVQSTLFGSKNIELGKNLGVLNIRYGDKTVNIRFFGTVGWFIRNISITDSQIIACIDDIFDQINKKYLEDTSFIELKVKEICKGLSEKVIYDTEKEKTLYDFLLVILKDSYEKDYDNVPSWVNSVIESFGKSEITESILYFIIESISSIVSDMTKDIYFNLKLTFDSWFLRFVLKRKTNNGQLSELMEVFGVSIKRITDYILEDYMSPSFTKGMGSLAKDLAISLLFDVAQYDTPNNIVSESLETENIKSPFQVTMCLGENPMSCRAFRWYCSKSVKDGCVRISQTEDFSEFIEVPAVCEKTVKPKTTIHWGITSNYATYEVSRFSAEVCNLERGIKYWYMVGSKKEDLWSSKSRVYIPGEKGKFTFINLLDSQGLVKEDYDIFCEVAEKSVSTVKDASFIVHLGDFVNDGNNEDYWDWVLDNKCFLNNALQPIAGNHETRVNSVVVLAGIENAILSHFNVRNLPKQDLSTGCYYSFEYENALFIVLNTGDFDKYGFLNENQFNWAINTAQQSKAKWKILLTHKSPYSNGPHHNDYDVKAMSDQIKELACMCNIDLLIAGHDHVYSRTPIMRYSEKTDYKEKLCLHNEIQYKTAINSFGTLFVVPGTSGVKNYKQDLSILYPSEVLMQSDHPMYSSVEVTNDHIYFTAYKYDVNSKTSEIFDTYAIEKSNTKNTADDLIRGIDSLPDCFLHPEKEKVLTLNKLYSELSYKEKVSIKNHPRLLESIKAINSADNVLNGKIVTVKNKKQFDEALQDKHVSTIITDCDFISFSSSLLGYGRYCVDRDLCIRGNAILKKVLFSVKNGVCLTLDDNVMIDNTREKGSALKALNCLEIFDDSVLILGGDASLRTEYGIGNGNICVCLFGTNCRAYFNSSGEIYGSKGAIFAPNAMSYVQINRGKYMSYAKYHTVRVNGSLTVNYGKIQSLYSNKDSDLFINGGQIGISEKNKIIPFETSGRVYVTGGNFSAFNNTSVVLRNNSKMHISPDHPKAVKFADNFPFIEDIISDEKNKKFMKTYLLKRRPKTLLELTENFGEITQSCTTGCEKFEDKKYTYSKLSISHIDDYKNIICCTPQSGAYLYSKL